MKKLLLVVTVFALPLTLAAQSQKDEVKKTYVEKCKKEFKSKMKDVKISDANLQQFCECNADKLLSKFTVEEVKKMDEILMNGTAQEKQVVNEKITPVVMPCFNEVQSKMK